MVAVPTIPKSGARRKGDKHLRSVSFLLTSTSLITRNQEKEHWGRGPQRAFPSALGSRIPPRMLASGSRLGACDIRGAPGAGGMGPLEKAIDQLDQLQPSP